MSREASDGGLDDPVTRHARTDFVAIGAHKSVQQALDSIRTAAAGGSFMYFYVTDDDGRLAGVMEARRLLTSPLDARVDAIMTRNVVAVPDSFTLLEACELFVLHRYLAFPVVDRERRILGVIDIGLFAKEMFEIEERDQLHNIFETLGVRLSDIREKSVWTGFRVRFPWLLATIGSGTICAVVVGLFQATLAKSLILAFFLTLVLGLGESVAMQTMAVTVHLLHHQSFGRGSYRRRLRRELGRAFLLGASCAVVVGCIARVWTGSLLPGAVIASGIVASLLLACFLGVSIPVVLHRLRLDLRVASGPLTLALTDICTIAAYFSLAAVLLGR
jgi:magnesium transporter